MTGRVSERPSAQDRRSIAALRARGYHVADIQSLATDQRAFAVRVPERRLTLAPGVRFHSRAVELGSGCFTNAFTLLLDLNRVRVEALSRTGGFHLRDLVGADAVLAAVTGSFSFISDDPAYQPAEACLDFCCRAGKVMSLPMASKPAFFVQHGQVVIGTLEAAGALTVQGRTYRWVGSKEQDRREPGAFTVFSASNCRVRYSDHPRTGYVRDVDPTGNITPPDPGAVDYVVSGTPDGGHRVTSVHPGGGADLFTGNFVLRADRLGAGRLWEGARVAITRVGGRDMRHVSSGLSIGPSVADAASGRTSAYDQSLGVSPFRDTRCARTLIGIQGQELHLQVLDGARHSDSFRGVCPRETADVCRAQGLDPRSVYHLDGGASSKIAFTQEGETHVVGSLHYLRWPQSDGEPFRWQGLDGRVLRSAFIVTGRDPRGTK